MATFPIEDNPNFRRYVATNGQTDFPFPFWAEEDEDVLCYINGQAALLNVDYHVEGVMSPTGGTVVTIPRDEGDVVAIWRYVKPDRTDGLSESGGGDLRGEALNLELSRLVAMVQDLYARVNRSLRLTPSAAVDGQNLTFDLADVANKVMVGKASGDGLEWVNKYDLALGATLTPTAGNIIIGDGSTWVTQSGVNLASDVSGSLPVAHLGGGAGATASTFFRGDGVWATPAGGGDVTGPSVTSSNRVALWDAGTKVLKDGPTYGTSGQVLTSNGWNVAPSFKTPAGASAATDTAAGVVELATDAEAATGTDATRAVTPHALAYALAALPLSKVYTSLLQTITPAGTLTLAHGLGNVPRLLDAWLVCLSADGGYSPGDYYHIGSQAERSYSAGWTRGHGLSSDATNVYVAFCNPTSGQVYAIVPKTGGALADADGTKWALLVRAWV